MRARAAHAAGAAGAGPRPAPIAVRDSVCLSLTSSTLPVQARNLGFASAAVLAQLDAAPLLRRLDLASGKLLSVRGTLRADTAVGGGGARHGLLGFQHLPDAVVRHILSYVPADARARASLVCRAWRDTVADARLWTVLDLSHASGVVQPVSNATPRGAAALARGRLTVLCLDDCYAVTDEARLEVVTANAGSLRELSCFSGILTCAHVRQLAHAAPQLVSLTVDVEAGVAEGTRMLRYDAPFGALQLRKLLIQGNRRLADEADLLAFCAAMSVHATLRWLEINDTPLGAPAVIDALSAAALACKLRGLGFCQCNLSPASVPALARVVGGGLLDYFSVLNDGIPLLDEAAAVQLADAVAASRTLTILELCRMRFWHDAAAAAFMMRAVTGHPFLEELNIFFNDPLDQSAAGAALGALVAANTPVLKKLILSCSSFNDAGLGGLCHALPHNSHLRELHCWNMNVSEAFVHNAFLPAVRANASLRRLDASTEWGGALLHGQPPPELLEVQALVQARSNDGA